jgi:hypothetical protein
MTRAHRHAAFVPAKAHMRWDRRRRSEHADAAKMGRQLQAGYRPQPVTGF